MEDPESGVARINFFGNSREFPGLLEWTVLVGISVAVNLVLYVWSRIGNSTVTRKGVDIMVSSSKCQNHLTHRERLMYGSLALVNATSEEISFRWSEFEEYLSDDFGPSNYFRCDANFAQAIVFGILHYYGVPSGLAGVCLTFVYGWIMGVLMEHVGDGGLFLPIVAHTITDFYILSIVARGKAAKIRER